MKLRQEQIVFVAVLLLLGLLSWRLLSRAEIKRPNVRSTEELELARYPAPDVGLALPTDGAHKSLARDLLSPPSDTRPLPPLDIVEPPRKPLAALLPPPEPGPAPAAYGALLRRELAVAIDTEAAAELFGDASAGEVDYDFEDFELFEDPAEKKGASLVDLLDQTGGQQEENPFQNLTAAELQKLLAGWK